MGAPSVLRLGLELGEQPAPQPRTARVRAHPGHADSRGEAPGPAAHAGDELARVVVDPDRQLAGRCGAPVASAFTRSSSSDNRWSSSGVGLADAWGGIGARSRPRRSSCLPLPRDGSCHGRGWWPSRQGPIGQRPNDAVRGSVRTSTTCLNARSRSDGCRSGSRSRGLGHGGAGATSTGEPAKTPPILRRPLAGVELAGIEPASSSVEPGLLRVQSVMSLFSAPALAQTRRRQAQSRKKSRSPLRDRR